MKNIFFALLYFTFHQYVYSQEYYIVRGDTLTKTEFKVRVKEAKKAKLVSKNKKQRLKFKYRVKKKEVLKEITYYSVNFVYFRPGAEPSDQLFNLLNKPFPTFPLKNIKNEQVVFRYPSKKPALVNLWFTTCPPCRKEIPELNRIKSLYQDKMNFVAITFEERQKVVNFLKKEEFNFEMLLDAKFYQSDKISGTMSYPVILLIDKIGVIRFVDSGIINYKDQSGKTIYKSSELIAEIETMIN